MKNILREAELSGARMTVRDQYRCLMLETQTCNENAIAFYRRFGFDLYSYSNENPERHEVRIELGKKTGL